MAAATIEDLGKNGDWLLFLQEGGQSQLGTVPAENSACPLFFR
jgi:hypothetical protein